MRKNDGSRFQVNFSRTQSKVNMKEDAHCIVLGFETCNLGTVLGGIRKMETLLLSEGD